eukprot:9273-Amphidinium_carterae.1
MDEQQLELHHHKPGHACHPWELNPTGEREDYPCGLVAHSVFTDKYVVLMKGPKSKNFTLLELDSSAQTIAWGRDALHDVGYHNMDPEGHLPGHDIENQAFFDMWLLKHFPPVICQQVDFAHQRFEPVTVATEEHIVRLPRRHDASLEDVSIELPKCKGYRTEHPTCEFTKGREPFACDPGSGYQQVTQREWGVENGHFLVWMRIATYPTFRKAWAKISKPVLAGSIVRVHFTD